MSRYSDARTARSVIIHHSISEPPSICTVIDKKLVINVDEIVDSLLLQNSPFLENLQTGLYLSGFWNRTGFTIKAK